MHQARSKKASPVSEPEPKNSDASSIPHGNKYSSLLSVKTFKANFIKYLTNKFVDKAVIVTRMYPLQLIVDSPSSSTLLRICDGNVNQHPPNKQGEADYAIWYHATHAPSSNVLAVSSDTDSWVYGLGIMEIGWLRGKTVYVKRSSASIPEFVNINSFSQCNNYT